MSCGIFSTTLADYQLQEYRVINRLQPALNTTLADCQLQEYRVINRLQPALIELNIVRT